VPLSTLDGYTSGEVWTLARALFNRESYSQRRIWFFEARAMVALMTLGLAWYIFRFAHELFGREVGLVALFFVAFNPTLIAHGRLMTTDMPVTVAMVVTLGELLRYLAGGSRDHACAAALMGGFALVAKYTGLLVIPIAGLIVVLAVLLRLGRYATATRWQALRSGLLLLTLSAATMLFVVNAAYRFEYTGATAAEMLSLPEPAPGIERGFGGDLLERHSFLTAVPSRLPIPLPYTYVFGLTSLRSHADGGHPTTFFGESMSHGHLAYFPVMLLIKTPSLILLGLLAALLELLRRRGRVSPFAFALALFAGVVLAIAMRTSINIGVRHVLPTMPVLALLGALGAVHGWRRVQPGPIRTGLVATAAALHLIGMAWSFPDYLGDFNAIAGGRRGGERVSVVGEEWGQDAARLGRELRARKIRSVYYNGSPFTARFELRRFRVTAKRISCPAMLPANATIAVSARDKSRDRRGCWRWTHGRTPLFDVDNHVFVYQTGSKPERGSPAIDGATLPPDAESSD
jgi:4-amino-4-deoxy-L-arabinose transferase-like glycosyltransferase